MINIAIFSWENVYWLSQLLLVAFAGIALISGRVVNNRQSTDLLTLRRELADAKTKQAEAEKSLLELQTFVTEGRVIDSEAASDVPKQSNFKGSIELLYAENSEDAYNISLALRAIFTQNGWSVSEPKPATGRRPVAGISVESTAPPRNTRDILRNPPRNSFETMYKAFAGLKTQRVLWDSNPRLSADAFVIVVGSKFW
jgi:hypothetical protein